MSNNAYALRSNRPDLRAARRRATLALVRPGAKSASKVPFLVTIGVMLLGGLVGLLMFNTSMQNVAFAQGKLQTEATNLAARQQTLQMELSQLNDPQHIAAQARQLGMVIPQSVAMLKVPSGQVLGIPTPANADSTPQLFAPNPKPNFAPPASATPRTPVKAATKPSTATKPAAKTATKTATTATKAATTAKAAATAKAGAATTTAKKPAAH